MLQLLAATGCQQLTKIKKLAITKNLRISRKFDPEYHIKRAQEKAGKSASNYRTQVFEALALKLCCSMAVAHATGLLRVNAKRQ